MKRSAFFLLLLLSLTVSTFAQQNQSSARQETAKAKTGLEVDVCSRLEAVGDFVDRAVDAQKSEIDRFMAERHGELQSYIATEKMFSAILIKSDDSIWEALVNCSKLTKDTFQKREAIRVAAMWERLRADAFQRMYLSEVAAAGTAPSAAQQVSAAPLQPEQARAAVDAGQEVDRKVAERARRRLMSDPSAWVAISFSDLVSDDELHAIVEHNRAVCDQVIVVTELTPAGLVLNYGSPDALTFLRKNYPRVCVLEDTTRFVPGVPRYLLVYANSKDAFTGFQPVQQTNVSPVYGSGTVTYPSGNMSRFSFAGTVETTGQVQTPYTVNSQTMFLYAYGEDGHTVSQRFITNSTQVGGDPAYAAGYNLGGLIARRLNSPQKLAENVLNDIQNDSRNYTH